MCFTDLRTRCVVWFLGLVEEPVRGAAEGGFEGLLRGAGRGIAGFLVKPLTGVLDLAHKTAEAIKVSRGIYRSDTWPKHAKHRLPQNASSFMLRRSRGRRALAHTSNCNFSLKYFAVFAQDASQVEGYQRTRRRLPRLLLGASRMLIAYDSEAAEAKAILTEAEGQYW